MNTELIENKSNILVMFRFINDEHTKSVPYRNLARAIEQADYQKSRGAMFVRVSKITEEILYEPKEIK